jgi:UDP-N-acetylmuramate dehydrogenase
MIKQDQLMPILDSRQIIPNAPMKDYTSFRVGGPCRYLLFPEDVEQLTRLLSLLTREKEPFLILGAGTDLLVMDRGYPGVVIKMAGDFLNIQVVGTEVMAGAGASLRSLAESAANNGLTGLEFAHGIPGSVGGGAYMNAGAYEGEMKQVMTRVHTLSRDGKEKRVYEREEMNLSYRKSVFQQCGDVITNVEYSLNFGIKNEISSRMEELMALRRSKQPLDLPSAGSFFKRPPGHFAGKLIQDAGLQGLSVGGARISPLHAGFIVNENQATAEDVITLMHLIQFTVKDKFGVELEPEVKIIGE